MAFDLSAGGRQDSIDHAEQAILVHCYEDGGGRYPEMCWLWEAFYDGPTIDPERATRLAVEFERAAEEIRRALGPSMEAAAARIAGFFRSAGESGRWVTARSD